MDFNYGIPGFGASGVGKMLSSFFHPEEGYEKAGEEMQKYYLDAQGNLRPYTQAGTAQLPQLTEIQRRLANPAQLENEWASGYTTSPYAQQLMNQSKEAGLGAASTMGLLGSSAALNNIQQSASDIGQSERQKFMDDLMQKYMASAGIGQNIYGTGANAAGAMSQNAMNQGQNMGQVAYARTNAPGEMFGKLLGTAANAGINYATGGVGGMGMRGFNQGVPPYMANSIYGGG